LIGVITHGCPDHVSIEDVGPSDQCVLCGEVSSTRVAPSSVPVCSLPWRHLYLELFRSALSTSRLYQPDEWPTNVDDMAEMYDSSTWSTVSTATVCLPTALIRSLLSLGIYKCQSHCRRPEREFSAESLRVPSNWCKI